VGVQTAGMIPCSKNGMPPKYSASAANVKS
jgi:hypothetical protein